MQCRNCHRIDGKGIDLGPDLSKIGKKYERAKLLETILAALGSASTRKFLDLARGDEGRAGVYGPAR